MKKVYLQPSVKAVHYSYQSTLLAGSAKGVYNNETPSEWAARDGGDDADWEDEEF